MEEVNRKDELSFAIVDFDGFMEHPRAILEEGGILHLKFRRDVASEKMNLGAINI